MSVARRQSEIAGMVRERISIEQPYCEARATFALPTIRIALLVTTAATSTSRGPEPVASRRRAGYAERR